MKERSCIRTADETDRERGKEARGDKTDGELSLYNNNNNNM